MTKIAVCGKGGVGKTTFTSLLVHALADEGRKVYAIDADPNPTLAEALGLPPETVDEITPIVEMKELIEERTGAKDGEYGSYFKLNPKVKDIPENFSVKNGNISYLMMGVMKGAGKGCACSQNAMLRSLVTYLIVKEKETVVMDMVAGTEHMGRGTAKAVDAMILVVEPGTRSIKAAREFRNMARDLGIKRVFAVGNKVVDADDEAFLREKMDDFDLIGFLPHDTAAIQAERRGTVLYESSPVMKDGMRSIIANLRT